LPKFLKLIFLYPASICGGFQVNTGYLTNSKEKELLLAAVRYKYIDQLCNNKFVLIADENKGQLRTKNDKGRIWKKLLEIVKEKFGKQIYSNYNFYTVSFSQFNRYFTRTHTHEQRV
jgi:hypothetical protein